MTKRVAENGASLDTIKRITGEFYSNSAGDDGLITINTELNQDVQEFTSTLKDALRKHLNGSGDALDTFKDALRQRSNLLSDPAVKNQGNGEVSAFLTNIVHISDSGEPEESLRLTKDLHANSLNPSYEGIEVKEPEKEPEQSNWSFPEC